MSLPVLSNPNEPTIPANDAEHQSVSVTAASGPGPVSWSRELKERLERLARATSLDMDPYPGTPAYNAARKLEYTIESTWRSYLLELVRNDLAAGISTGRRKHHWEKNECLIVYEFLPGAKLEEFPSTDVEKREEYLARTVTEALYIKAPQFSSNFTFPWPSPTNGPAKPSSAAATMESTTTETDLANADAKLRASLLVTPPASPPPGSGMHSPTRPSLQMRHTMHHPPIHTLDASENMPGVESIVEALENLAVNGTSTAPESGPTVRLSPPTPAPGAIPQSQSAPSSPVVTMSLPQPDMPSSPVTRPPSALASVLIGIGTAHALGAASPRVPTEGVQPSEWLGKGSPSPASKAKELATTPPLSPVATPDREVSLGEAEAPVQSGLGLSLGLSALEISAQHVDDEEVPLSPSPNDDDEEEASIHSASRHSLVRKPSFQTLNPALSLDAEIERRRSPSPAPPEVPAPELVYYGSGANSEEEDADEDVDFEAVPELEEQPPKDNFRTLNPAISLDAEIARCSPSPVPFVPLVQVDQHEEEEEEEEEEKPETFKSLNPAVSLDAEIVKILSRPPSPTFVELNEDVGLEREIERIKSAVSSPVSKPIELSPASAPAPEAHNSSPEPTKKETSRALTQRPVTLPFFLGTGVLRLFRALNPFAYLLLSMRTSSHYSSYPPEPYPVKKLVVPRPLLRRVLPAFIWRWAGKDAEYNLQRVGLGRGVSSLGTRYDAKGGVVGLGITANGNGKADKPDA